LSILKAFFDAPIVESPYRHLYAEGVFGDLYQDILRNLPDGAEWKAHNAANRDYFPLGTIGFGMAKGKAEFWKDVSNWLCSKGMIQACLDKFGIKKQCYLAASIVRQRVGYSLGPHTDSPNKVLTLLFYLPAKDDDLDSGTVVYVPKDRGLRCSGNKHHDFKDFDVVKKMPFKPDSVFAFEKSNISFHGVETVKKVRDVLQYNINA